MAPYSDCDVVLLVSDDTEKSMLFAVSDWLNRYINQMKVADGAYCGDLGRLDVVDNMHPEINDLMGVARVKAAVTSGGRTNPDLRVLLAKGDAMPILDAFTKQLAARRDVFRDRLKAEGLGTIYENGLQLEIKNAGWLKDTFDVKTTIKILIRAAGMMAAASGEPPVGTDATYENITLRRLQSPAYGFNKDFPEAYKMLWEMRYRLHFLNGSEGDKLDKGNRQHNQMWEVLNNKLWPILRVALPTAHNRLMQI